MYSFFSHKNPAKQCTHYIHMYVVWYRSHKYCTHIRMHKYSIRMCMYNIRTYVYKQMCTKYVNTHTRARALRRLFVYSVHVYESPDFAHRMSAIPGRGTIAVSSLAVQHTTWGWEWTCFRHVYNKGVRPVRKGRVLNDKGGDT